MTMSHDGRRLAVGYENGPIQVFDLGDTAATPTELYGHERGVRRLSFSPDGRWLASLDETEALMVWDMRGPRPSPLGTFSPLMDITERAGNSAREAGSIIYTRGLAFGRDNRTLAVAIRDKIALWDVESRSAVWTFEAFGEGLSFSPDGRTLAGGGHREVTLLDTSPASWVARARCVANRGFTEAELRRFMSDTGARLANAAGPPPDCAPLE
jgi:WD40 repeat protein